MPKISVIVPVYKVEPYLRKCIDSILGQTFRDFELILVDDGSPDQCGEICDEYAEKYDNVVVIHQTNGGLSAARNSGIDWAFANSDSQWIAFVDSDDWLHRDYLLTLFEEAKKNDADLVVCDFVRVNDREENIEKDHQFNELVTSDKDALFRYLYTNWRIRPAWNKLYRKTLFEALRFQVGKIHEDDYFIHHVLLASEITAIMDACRYFYRIRENSIMATPSPKSLLDGLEAKIEQYEFCQRNNLPLFEYLVSEGHMKRVAQMGEQMDAQSKQRYDNLKDRYDALYLQSKANQFPKGSIRSRLGRMYRRLSKLLER